MAPPAVRVGQVKRSALILAAVDVLSFWTAAALTAAAALAVTPRPDIANILLAIALALLLASHLADAAGERRGI